MKNSLPFGILFVALVAGCGDGGPAVEQAPPTEQKVVMVPAVGGGAPANTNQGQPGSGSTPAPNPNATPDTMKQPGDK